MGKIYAKTDDGRAVLIEIKCDSCGAKRKPGPDGEGWIVAGSDNGIGTQKTHLYYCPKCSAGRA